MLSGNSTLDNKAFEQQVYESGSANNQIKIGRKLEKGYYGKLLAKLHKQSSLLTVHEPDYDDVTL